MKYIGQKRCDIPNFHRYLGSGLYIKRAINKYGRDSFIRETLAEVNNQEQLDDLEKYYIDYYNAVESDLFYNLDDGGKTPYTGEPIAAYTKDGTLVGEYTSLRHAGRELNIAYESIKYALNHSGWSKKHKLKFIKL